MKRFLITTLATASLLGMAAPAMAATAYPIGVVNIRSGPGTQNAIIGTISEGQTAQVLSKEGNWLKVAAPAGGVGYMADWVTREVFDDQATFLQVDTDVLNVRTEPDPAAPSLGQVQQGQQLRILEGLAGWYKVDAGLIGTGWIKGEYTYRITTPPATAQPTPPPEKVEVPPTGPVKDVQAVRSTTIYNGRSSEYEALAAVRPWEHLTYLDSAEGWFKVAKADGTRGWVNGTAALLTDKYVEFSRQAVYGVKEGDWSMGFLKVREVVPGGGGLALRSGPSADAGIIRNLAEGARLKLLQIPGGEYVQVMREDGETGWVSRNWLRPVPGLPEESVRLRQTSPGVIRLDLSGQVGGISAAADTLTVALPENGLRQAGLTIGEYGALAVSLDAQGLVLRFDDAFRYQVVSNTGGNLVVEIRPVVEQVQALKGADRDIYRMQIGGTVSPAVHREGDTVLVDLPGARLADGLALPAGMTALADAGGVTLRITSPRAFALKRSAGTLDLELLAPGLAGKTIVVDPGHGGIETGAVGPAGLLEKNANLGIALKLKSLLESAGARVLMTRTGDTRCATATELAKVPTADEKLHVDLNCRSALANTAGADAFLSIHSNASGDPSVTGTETYWSEGLMNSARSQALAGLLQGEMVTSLAQRNLGAKTDIFYVTLHSEAPAVLAEVAFISNPTEERLLGMDLYRQQAAEALFRGLSRFWN